MRPDFTILVDGKSIASEKLSGKPMNAFFDVTYPIPAELTKGKSTITVRIQTTPGKGGASVSGMRLVRAK